MSVRLTPQQAQALAELTGRVGDVVLHQLEATSGDVQARDVYATPHGTASGYRIAIDGSLSSIGETLSARD